jgi:hypothetical protein
VNGKVMKTLFSGSRFIFWGVAPLLVLCAVALTFNASYASLWRVGIVILTDLFIGLLVIGLYSPRRNEWALRCVTGAVFILYLGYWMDELREGKLLPSAEAGVESILAATLGLFLIGLPCLRFAWKGFPMSEREDGRDQKFD